MTKWPTQQDDATPPSAPFQLYVDPAFRPQRIEASRSKFYAGAAAIIAVGLVVGAISLLWSEQSAEESRDAAVSAAIAPGPDAQTPSAHVDMPLIPPVAAAPTADTSPSTPAPDLSANAPRTEEPVTMTPTATPTASPRAVATHDSQPKPRQEIRHRRVAVARLQPRDDGPPIDATDLPPLDPAVQQPSH
jgi:hypothetical protein